MFQYLVILVGLYRSFSNEDTQWVKYFFYSFKKRNFAPSNKQQLMGQLKASGKEVVHEDKGNIVVINTCGFINNAKEESINTILEYIQKKEEGLVDKVFVMGCLSERYKPDLQK